MAGTSHLSSEWKFYEQIDYRELDINTNKIQAYLVCVMPRVMWGDEGSTGGAKVVASVSDSNVLGN